MAKIVHVHPFAHGTSHKWTCECELFPFHSSTLLPCHCLTRGLGHLWLQLRLMWPSLIIERLPPSPPSSNLLPTLNTLCHKEIPYIFLQPRLVAANCAVDNCGLLPLVGKQMVAANSAVANSCLASCTTANCTVNKRLFERLLFTF